MTMENPPFEDVFPIENECHVSFQGCSFDKVRIVNMVGQCSAN